jgi:hypothetical protein
VTDYEHGIMAAVHVVRDRARRVGNALDSFMLEREIRERLLYEEFAPQHELRGGHRG